MYVNKKYTMEKALRYLRRLKNKRYIAMLFIVMLSVLGVILAINTKKDSEKKPLREINSIVSTAKEKGPVIVIDPGHGSSFNMKLEPMAPGSKIKRVIAPVGAIGIYTKVPEYKVDLDVAKKLKIILEEKGFTVVMTKNELSENPGGIERAEVGNKADARLVVRIHADSFEDSKVKGTSILVPEAANGVTKEISEESNRCASIILDRMIKDAGVRGRGVTLRKDLTAFNWSKVPTLLIEMGFLSNKEEDILLNTEEYQDKIARAIANGIEDALKVKEEE